MRKKAKKTKDCMRAFQWKSKETIIVFVLYIMFLRIFIVILYLSDLYDIRQVTGDSVCGVDYTSDQACLREKHTSVFFDRRHINY
jgi:hypothetical protein